MRLEIIGFWPDYDDDNAYAVVQIEKTIQVINKLKLTDLRFVVDSNIIEVWVPITEDGKYISSDESATYIDL